MIDLTDHLGAWTGTWSTFLEPDKLYDQSPLQATIARVDGGFVIDYQGSIGSDPVSGRLGWSQNGETTTVEWLDSWHTAGRTEELHSSGDAPPSYVYAGDGLWVWDITIDATSRGIVITHHNTGPGIPRYVGVLMNLEARAS